MDADEDAERWIGAGYGLEDASVGGGRELQATVPLGDGHSQEAVFAEGGYDVIADDFFPVEAGRVDQSAKSAVGERD